MNWEDRLRKARAQREKILRSKATTGPPPGKERLGRPGGTADQDVKDMHLVSRRPNRSKGPDQATSEGGAKRVKRRDTGGVRIQAEHVASAPVLVLKAPANAPKPATHSATKDIRREAAPQHPVLGETPEVEAPKRARRIAQIGLGFCIGFVSAMAMLAASGLLNVSPGILAEAEFSSPPPVQTLGESAGQSTLPVDRPAAVEMVVVDAAPDVGAPLIAGLRAPSPSDGLVGTTKLDDPTVARSGVGALKLQNPDAPPVLGAEPALPVPGVSTVPRGMATVDFRGFASPFSRQDADISGPPGTSSAPDPVRSASVSAATPVVLKGLPVPPIALSDTDIVQASPPGKPSALSELGSLSRPLPDGLDYRFIPNMNADGMRRPTNVNLAPVPDGVFRPTVIARPPEPMIPNARDLPLTILAASGTAAESIDDASATAKMLGFETVPINRVTFRISQNQVRYYDEATADAARILADRIDAVPRDFTNATVNPPSGTLEIYLAGSGSRISAVTQARPSEADRLREQVLSRLRAGPSN